MIKQSDGTFKASSKKEDGAYHSTTLNVKSDAVHRNSKTNKKTSLAVGSYGKPNMRTNVYTYWTWKSNTKSEMKRQVVVSAKIPTIKAQPPAVVQQYDPYAAVNNGVNVESYNCAGLATRCYRYMGLVELQNLFNTYNKSVGVQGDVKYWLWKYNLHMRDSDGVINSLGPDFHVVSGRLGSGAQDPQAVWSKNGYRPIMGPGTGGSFKPPTEEPATYSHKAEAPVLDAKNKQKTKMRTSISETQIVLPLMNII